MKTLISFHKSTDVQPHTTDIDIVPRLGDLLDLPDVDSRHLYPVERVIYRLTRPQDGMEVLEVPVEGVAVRIYLGRPIGVSLLSTH
jgi:hypothetical protein